MESGVKIFDAINGPQQRLLYQQVRAARIVSDELQSRLKNLKIPNPRLNAAIARETERYIIIDSRTYDFKTFPRLLARFSKTSQEE